MTDNEIIKALECCKDNNCNECPIKGCTEDIFVEALDLIDRQKAEIEKLENDFVNITKIAKSEAIKEFAERLKEKFGIADCIVTVNNNDIDNLVKEMTEVNENDR